MAYGGPISRFGTQQLFITAIMDDLRITANPYVGADGSFGGCDNSSHGQCSQIQISGPNVRESGQPFLLYPWRETNSSSDRKTGQEPEENI